MTQSNCTVDKLEYAPYFRDLKRDVAKKLEKLERRTQRAIVELIRKYSINLVMSLC